MILLAPTTALGPVVERDRVLEPNWILWPPGEDEIVRLQSLTTGVDWSFGPHLFAIRTRSSGSFLLEAAALQNRGLFEARRRAVRGRRLVPLPRLGGALSQNAIALCSDGVTPIRPATDADLQDPTALIIATAPDGEAIVRARRLVSGRILMIESPSQGSRWSRFYLYGRDWPPGQSPILRNVPGLVPARDAADLVLQPSSFSWVPQESLRGREADRWLEPAHSGWPTWGAALLGLIAAGAALFEVSQDRRGLATTLATYAALAFPAAVLASPVVGASLGPEYSVLAVSALLIPLVGIAWLISRTGREDVALALMAGFGTVVAGWAGPLHPWSGVLRDLSNGSSPEAVGAAALYIAVGVAATRNGQGPLWLLVRLANVGTLAAFLLRTPQLAFVVPIAWAAGMSWLAPSVFPALVALPQGLARLTRGGVDYRPHELVREFPAEAATNLWHFVAFVGSFPTLLFGAVVGFAAMIATPYATHRLRRAEAWPGRAALLSAAGLAAACLLTPELWPGVLVIVAGGLPLFVADAR